MLPRRRCCRALCRGRRHTRRDARWAERHYDAMRLFYASALRLRHCIRRLLLRDDYYAVAISPIDDIAAMAIADAAAIAYSAADEMQRKALMPPLRALYYCFIR